MPNSNTPVAERPLYTFRFNAKTGEQRCDLSRPLRGYPDATVEDRVKMLDEAIVSLSGLSDAHVRYVISRAYTGIELVTANRAAVLGAWSAVIASVLGDATGASGVLECSIDGGGWQDYDLARGENVMQGQAGKG